MKSLWLHSKVFRISKTSWFAEKVMRLTHFFFRPEPTRNPPLLFVFSQYKDIYTNDTIYEGTCEIYKTSNV